MFKTKDEADKYLIERDEPTAILEFPEYRKVFDEEYAKDRAGFKFECSVWGQFLRVSLAKMNNSDPYKFFSTALNLHNINRIHLENGHAPDFNGQLIWTEQYVSEKDIKEKNAVSYIFKNCNKNEEYHIYLTSRLYPDISASRSMFVDYSGTADSHYGYCHINSELQYRTKNVPRPAGDDIIKFEGINCVLLVPFGEGEKVLEQLLLATK